MVLTKQRLNIFLSQIQHDIFFQVLKAFPSADLTEDDLIQNPQFCKLLAKLSSHVDSTGLTESLRKELEKAEYCVLNN